MLQNQIEGLPASLLAQVREQRDVAANQRLQSRANRAEDRARAHYDTAHYSERARHAKTIQFELRRHHVVRYHPPTTCIAGCHRLFLSKYAFAIVRRAANYNANLQKNESQTHSALSARRSSRPPRCKVLI